MFQIDNASAATTQPASTPPGTAGFFTDGNPATSVPATIVPAEWLNSVMMEIMNAVTGTGQTPNKAAFNQLLTAIQTLSQNPGVTPPQFDNSNKTATTKFVQQAIGNFSNQLQFNTNQIITAAQAGSTIVGYGTATIGFTLPSTASVPPGTAYWFWSNNTSAGGVTLACAGSDVFNVASTAVSSVALKNGDSFFVVKGGTNQWIVFSGSNQLQYSSGFASSLNSPGYQRLPTGLIMQWGQTPVVGNGAQISVSYPIAFPNGPLAITGSYTNSGGGNGSAGIPFNIYYTASTTQFGILNGGTAGAQYNFLALGH